MIEKSMPNYQYNGVIRLLKTSSIGYVQSIRSGSQANLKRLGVARNLKAGAKKTPKGSDQVNVLSILNWMAKITPEDTNAITQLVAIDATACQREV